MNTLTFHLLNNRLNFLIYYFNATATKFLSYFAFCAGVTTMLNFFTTSNGFRSTLPVVSNLTAMNVWDGVCMCFIYASLLEFVCVNYVGRKRPLHNVVYRPGENPVTQVNTPSISLYLADKSVINVTRHFVYSDVALMTLLSSLGNQLCV